MPLVCGRRFSARTFRSSGSLTEIGRSCSITLSVCTEPIAGKGNSREVSRRITVGNTSVNGYVTGSVSPNRSPHTFAYAARLSWSTRRPDSASVSFGRLRRPDGFANGNAPNAARA